MSKQIILIEELIIKYARRKKLSKRELLLLQQWQNTSDHHRTLPELFRDHEWLRDSLQRMSEVPTDRMWEYIRERITDSINAEPANSPGKRRRLLQWSAAAVLVPLLMVSGYHFIRPGSPSPHPPVAPVIAKADIGDHQVILTLSDGSKYGLDGAPNGEIAKNSNTSLVKKDSLTLVYETKPGEKAVTINDRITTGKTDPFKLVLPDGSVVKLCYASCLSTHFSEKARELTITGQAQFEVAKDATRPFLVHVNGMTVEVLGTNFNVSNYTGEAGAVSLFSGAVKVVNGDKSRLLKPNEQVVLNGDELVSHRIDPDKILSWADKDPVFRFEGADLRTVLCQMARWYQVKISIPDNVTGIPITGIFRQKESLDVNLQLIDVVESGSARLKRTGKTIVVTR